MRYVFDLRFFVGLILSSLPAHAELPMPRTPTPNAPPPTLTVSPTMTASPTLVATQSPVPTASLTPTQVVSIVAVGCPPISTTLMSCGCAHQYGLPLANWRLVLTGYEDDVWSAFVDGPAPGSPNFNCQYVYNKCHNAVPPRPAGEAASCWASYQNYQAARSENVFDNY